MDLFYDMAQLPRNPQIIYPRQTTNFDIKSIENDDIRSASKILSH